MSLEQFPEILHLSVDEKILLVEELWDNIAASPKDIPLHDWQIKELDKRLVAHEINPDDVVSWEETKKDILDSR
ncbi:MAG: addiction module protein [Ignavibacteriales bacterium]|nr:addiction module protein [Ignavibacteriales bacterium]